MLASRRLSASRFRESSPHAVPDIPDTHSLVPSRTGGPALRPKQTPVDSTNELRMSHHGTHFSSRSRNHAHLSIPIPLHSLRTPISPHPTRHVITCTQQRI